MNDHISTASKTARSFVCGPVSRDGWAIAAILYATICASAAVAAFDGFWVVNLGTCGVVVTLWLKPSKGICLHGSGFDDCNGWDSDFVQENESENWRKSADYDYKPAFTIFVTVIAVAAFMFLFCLVASTYARFRNPYSQYASVLAAFIISCLALGASSRTTDTFFTDPDNYNDGNCDEVESYAASGYITGNICWILGLSIIIMTIFPFCKCLLGVVDDAVDHAEKVVAGNS